MTPFSRSEAQSAMLPRIVLRFMIAVLVVAGISLTGLWMLYSRGRAQQVRLQHSDPYQLAVRAARDDSQVTAALGPGWSALPPSGDLVQEDGDGEAHLHIPLRGHAGAVARLRADLHRAAGRWTLQPLQLTLPDGRTIPLLPQAATGTRPPGAAPPPPARPTPPTPQPPPTEARSRPEIVSAVFARTPRGPALETPRFSRRDDVHLRVRLGNLKLDSQRQASFCEDLRVTRFDQQVILDQRDVANATVALRGPNDRVTVRNRLELGRNPLPGRYLVRITIRDLHSHQQTAAEYAFRLD